MWECVDANRCSARLLFTFRCLFQQSNNGVACARLADFRPRQPLQQQHDLSALSPHNCCCCCCHCCLPGVLQPPRGGMAFEAGCAFLQQCPHAPGRGDRRGDEPPARIQGPCWCWHNITGAHVDGHSFQHWAASWRRLPLGGAPCYQPSGEWQAAFGPLPAPLRLHTCHTMY